MGDFGVGLSGSYFTKYDVAQTPTAPILDRRSYINFPIKYRIRGNVNWRKDNFNGSIAVNYQPSYFNDTVVPTQKVKEQALIDLYAANELKDAASWLEGTTVSVNVQNLFDKDPPFFNVNGGFDPQNYSPIGRLVTFGINKTW
jgi:iron complex outermembrane receptor protein